MGKELMPVSVSAGIYDFSGTAASHVYAQEGMNLSPADIKTLTATWWDGSSSNWTSDDEFSELCTKGHKAEAEGVNYMLVVAKFDDEHKVDQGGEMVPSPLPVGPVSMA